MWLMTKTKCRAISNLVVVPILSSSSKYKRRSNCNTISGIISKLIVRNKTIYLALPRRITVTEITDDNI